MIRPIAGDAFVRVAFFRPANRRRRRRRVVTTADVLVVAHPVRHPTLGRPTDRPTDRPTALEGDLLRPMKRWVQNTLFFGNTSKLAMKR